MKKNFCKFFTACSLLIVLCFSIVLPCVISSKNELMTRDIQADELGTLTYDEKVNKF